MHSCSICPASFCTEPPVGEGNRRRGSGPGVPHTLGTAEGGRGGSGPYPPCSGPQSACEAAVQALGREKVGRGFSTFGKGRSSVRKRDTHGGEL